MLTGRYSFTQAVLECTSGYSTTGLSVVDVGQTSHMFLFFRSVMLFVGGIGLVLVVISVLSDRYGMKIKKGPVAAGPLGAALCAAHF